MKKYIKRYVNWVTHKYSYERVTTNQVVISFIVLPFFLPFYLIGTPFRLLAYWLNK